MRARYLIGGLAVVALIVTALFALGEESEGPDVASTSVTSSTTTPAPTSASTPVASTTAPLPTLAQSAQDCAPVTVPHVRVSGWFPDISASNEATGLIDGAFVVGNAVFLQFPEAGGPAVMTVNSFVQGDPDAEIRSAIFNGVARALGEPGEGSLTYDASTATVEGAIPLSVSTFPTGALPPDPAPEMSDVSIQVDLPAGTVDGTIAHPDGTLEVAGGASLVDARTFSSLECYRSTRESEAVSDMTP